MFSSRTMSLSDCLFSGYLSELKITGTLPEAGSLKPIIWWNHQAPAKKKHARSSGENIRKADQKMPKTG